MKFDTMKHLALACLLAVSSLGHANSLHPQCYTLYDQYMAATDWAVVGQIADKMHDAQCWPALQNSAESDRQHVLQPATDCPSLATHVIKMINDQSHANGYSVLQVVDAKAMTYETIDKVAENGRLYDVVTNSTTGQSIKVPNKLKYDDKIYVRGEGHYLSWVDWRSLNPNAVRYGDSGTVLVPNSAPFAASPLTGNTRALDCSAEAKFTQGSYLIQMTLDRNASRQEFIGMSVLMEM